jgi:hypothetical protein
VVVAGDVVSLSPYAEALQQSEDRKAASL